MDAGFTKRPGVAPRPNVFLVARTHNRNLSARQGQINESVDNPICSPTCCGFQVDGLLTTGRYGRIGLCDSAALPVPAEIDARLVPHRQRHEPVNLAAVRLPPMILA